ncbi:transcription termination factor 2 [Nasonia vitripennis]|uniref:Transcription termination factor 2 n=1 Tax=Nasonia vitripennis TaxID=7425 RepID=A0A7M7H3A7_NASVI|nr:transcription termination factor 2 [Nasonia vitripennis]XP_008204613.1 transcription termination factor 2 [Nasonia vitripennis]XP_008204614.1 transcription termination factor 2 [Nasonia vitripennis]XP_008204615.1 transcription termination factor 2 [Nasonia vitripennis]XP_008204616.1 transcription termination factor 2 [Nasonia vitripennis]
MNYRNSKREQSSSSRDDSLIFESSGDESDSPYSKGNSTAARTGVINESDSSSEDSERHDPGSDQSIDSEEEDIQFMNTSHRVSIVESSSESDSDNDDLYKQENKQSKNLKRRSIYDNPISVDTPNSISTPIHSSQLRKKTRRVMYSDSESDKENFSGNQEKRKNAIMDEGSEDDIEEMNSESENPREQINVLNESSINISNQSSNYQDSSKGSNNVNKKKHRSSEHLDLISDDSYNELGNLKPTSSNDKNTSETENVAVDRNSISERKSTSKNESSYELESDDAEQSFENVANKSEGKFIPQRNRPFLTEKKSASNVIDLTMNESIHEHSMNDKVKVSKKEQKIEEGGVIICSSTSTSENEMDNEVITLAKKEIGVGNIDPIEAQKKEFILLNIEHSQKQLDKLHKFATSVDINRLPDKGAKVHKSMEELETKIASFKEKLAKYSRKTNTPARLSSLKVKEESKSKVKPLVEKNLISPLSEDKMDVKKKIENSHVKRELYANNDPAFSEQFDNFDVHEIPKVPQTTFKTDDLGKKALETLNKQQSLTSKRLEQLHGSLTLRPAEDQREKDPAGLKVPLMDHQQHALAWMKWREKQKPKGGILADDMGLGKTLTMISLVLATVNDEKQNDSDDSSSSSSDDGWMSKNKHKRYYGGTLVVCPASLIKQWEAEVKNRCKRGLLSVLVFHGNNRAMDDRKLSKYNIVVTTYQIIVREAGAESGMYRMEWNRIILDEAHYIRNHKSKACIAVCGLTAKHRWALTGTPIQNKEMDLYAILKFLKCSPFDDLQVWKRWVDNKNDAGKQRLITIMKGLMLRRTKQELQAKGSLDSLPDKSIELIEIEMDRDETLAYQKILLFSQNLFAQFLAQRAEKQHVRELYGGKFDKPSYSSYGSKTQFTKAQKVLLEHHSSIEAHEILVLLLRLRQMCCHPALIHAMLDQQDAEVNGLDEDIDPNTELLNKLQNMSINQEDEEVEDYVADYKIDNRVAANLLTKKNPVFDDERRSSKVRAIVKTIEEILEKGDKIIVVSQWTSFLGIVAKNLDDIEDAKYAMFTGNVAVKNRQAIVDKFNDPNEDTNILLLSLTAGGVGLNLVGANHLLLIDIHWNPQLESQAQDRIYRFGQKKNVYVYKFICKDTIEERVKNLQDKKLEIANHVLTGSRAVSSKLTIDDLKLLFS